MQTCSVAGETDPEGAGLNCARLSHLPDLRHDLVRISGGGGLHAPREAEHARLHLLLVALPVSTTRAHIGLLVGRVHSRIMYSKYPYIAPRCLRYINNTKKKKKKIVGILLVQETRK